MARKGSVLDEKKRCPKRALTEQRLESDRVRTETGPWNRQVVWSKEMKYWRDPFWEVSMLQSYEMPLVQKLIPVNTVACIRSCGWMLTVCSWRNPRLFFMSHEAVFHLSDFVNEQSTSYLKTENPHTTHEFPPQDQKVVAEEYFRLFIPLFILLIVNSKR